ncbi:oligosaccharide flippase family protein [Desulfocastanea catecholica]
MRISSASIKKFFYIRCPQRLRPYWDRVEKSDVGSRLARGAFWSITGALISRGMMLLASIFIARILGREVYGEYGIIRSTVGMFFVFAGAGLGLTATKFVAEFRISEPARVGRIMAITNLFALFTGAFVATTVYIAAPWLAESTINAPHLSVELRVGAVILFINALNGAQIGALAGFEAFKSIARINTLVGLTSFPLLVAGANWGGVRGTVFALATTTGINWWLNHKALRIEATKWAVHSNMKDCLIELPTLWRFGLPAAISGFMVTPVFWVCNVLLVNQPDGYSQMGIYDAANHWKMAILFIPGMVAQIVLPMLSNLNGLNDQLRYRKVLKWNVIINGGCALAVGLPVALLSPWIMASYGAGFEAGFWVMIVLILTAIPMSITTVVGRGIASKGRMWVGLLFNLAWAIALIVFCLLFIQKGFGALGLALANMLSYLLHFLWQTIYLSKLLKPVSRPVEG